MRANPWTSYGRGHYCVLDLYSYLRFHLLSHYKGAMQHRDIKFVYVLAQLQYRAVEENEDRLKFTLGMHFVFEFVLLHSVQTLDHFFVREQHPCFMILCLYDVYVQYLGT